MNISTYSSVKSTIVSTLLAGACFFGGLNSSVYDLKRNDCQKNPVEIKASKENTISTSLVIQRNLNDYFQKLIMSISNSIDDDDLVVGGNIVFSKKLTELRNDPFYRIFLNEIINFKNDNVAFNHLLFLSTIPFDQTYGYEEDFVIQCLKKDDSIFQELSTNVICCWGKLSNKIDLNKISFKNIYLKKMLSSI